MDLSGLIKRLVVPDGSEVSRDLAYEDIRATAATSASPTCTPRASGPPSHTPLGLRHMHHSCGPSGRWSTSVTSNPWRS